VKALSEEGMSATCDRMLLIQALVEWIACDPFQAVYRQKRLVGELATGWPERLSRYFWPKPTTGYAENSELLQPICEEGTRLARKLETNGEWSDVEAFEAVQLAQRVFKWGGGGPDRVTEQQVRSVLINALHDKDVEHAPMGSGWSKVAALSTSHLEAVDGRDPQAIWDSRVSTAIVSRLDRMLVAAGATEVPLELQRLRLMCARSGSGTRPRQLQLSEWSQTQGTWDCQLFGSAFVREMREVLNDEYRPSSGQSYPAMPLPDGSEAPWTVRGVEMVLFMDGY
jgi:hypothetical protein